MTVSRCFARACFNFTKHYYVIFLLVKDFLHVWVAWYTGINQAWAKCPDDLPRDLNLHLFIATKANVLVDQ